MLPIDEIGGGIAMVIAVAGVLLCNRKLRICFLVWLVSNILCGIIHAYAEIWSLLIKDFIFLILCIEGWFRWKPK